jgi:hypothetical protein
MLRTIGDYNQKEGLISRALRTASEAIGEPEFEIADPYQDT